MMDSTPPRTLRVRLAAVLGATAIIVTSSACAPDEASLDTTADIDVVEDDAGTDAVDADADADADADVSDADVGATDTIDVADTIDAPDAIDAADTIDAPDAIDAADTIDAPDAMDAADTIDAADTSDATDLGDVSDAGDAPDDVIVDPACANHSGEPNDEGRDATRLVDGSEHLGQICDDDEDWFRVEVDAGRTVSFALEFDHALGDLDMEVFDISGQLQETSETVSDREVVRVTSTGLELFVRVYGYQGATNTFALRVAVFEADDAFACAFTGEVRYEDRLFDTGGFTGEVRELPASMVRVDVVRVFDDAVVGSGVTGESGEYAIEGACHEDRRYQVRALAITEQFGTTLTTRDASDAASLHSEASVPVLVSSADSSHDVDVSARADGLGGAFHIIDVMTDAVRLIAAHADTPTPNLDVLWEPGNAFDCGSCYSGGVMQLGGQVEDPDEYDDAIILHEFGHHFIATLSADSSRGGTHRDLRVDPRLAYGEGVAYFFAAMVADDPNIIDNFESGSRHIDLEAVLQQGEALSVLKGTSDGTQSGLIREEIIAAIMWDAYDAASPSEAHDTVEIGVDGHMRILLDYFGEDSRAPDLGPRGIDLVDWLNALACDESTPAGTEALAAEREFPWTASADLNCAFSTREATIGADGEGPTQQGETRK